MDGARSGATRDLPTIGAFFYFKKIDEKKN